MSTAVLDDRDQRRAEARAQAAAILDAPRRPRRYARPATGLRPSARSRLHARAAPLRGPRPRRSALRRVVALGLLLLQVTLLVLGLTLPAFQVQRVSVSGLRLLSGGDVMAAAAVPRQSIFTVDADSIRQRVLALPWIQTATVTTDLPSSVRITVAERPAELRDRRGGSETLLAGDGAAMVATASLDRLASGAPTLLDDRAGTPQAIAPQLVHDLAVLAARFPATFGCAVATYQWGVDGVVSIWASTGWRAILGHLDTADALAALPAQLQTLGALRGALDFTRPDFGYVDLENPAQPAVGGSPGLPAEVQSAAQPLGAAG